MSNKARIIMYSILAVFIALAVYAHFYGQSKKAQNVAPAQTQTQVQQQDQAKDNAEIEVIN